MVESAKLTRSDRKESKNINNTLALMQAINDRAVASCRVDRTTLTCNLLASNSLSSKIAEVLMNDRPGEGCDAELAFEIDQDMKVGASLLSRSSKDNS